MLVTIQFPIFDARGLNAANSARLVKPNWPLPLPGRQFVRGFGVVVSRRVNGLNGFFSEDRLCIAKNAIRLATPAISHIQAPDIAFRHLFADGDLVAKIEIGFVLPATNPKRQLKRDALSTIIAQLLKRN